MGGFPFSRLIRPALCALALGSSLVPMEARGPWLEWKDCRLEANDSNDGDSFHVKADGKNYILRLYLVDAPESEESFPERVAEQGKYFGITPAQSVQVGEAAAKFVEEKLAQPFSVRTCKQGAMGRSNAVRYYAFVQTSEGDLGELLVANGLARVHGAAPAEDETFSPKAVKTKLRRFEQEARRLQVGGWGARTGRMNARLLSPGKKKELDSFDTFFHPERAIVARPQVSLPKPDATAGTAAPALPSVGGKLDANTATVDELVNLKGIGPVLAQRIIEARPFKNADGLRRVKGIGPKKYGQIRPFFAAAPP